jgi:predicted transposase YbfD/YdcC
VAKIIGYGADYLIGLKGNQGTFYDNVKSVFDTGLLCNPKEFISKSFTTQAEKAGGRVEHRVITVVKLTSASIHEWLTTADDWAGIRTIIKVEKCNDTDGSSEIRYFVSSLDRNPSQIAEIQKLHWQVETLHKVLDDRNSFDEDHCKIHRGNGAEILSTIRKLGINFLAPIRQASSDNESQKESFSSILKLLNNCNEYLEEILTKHPDKIPPPSVWRERIGTGMYAK